MDLCLRARILTQTMMVMEVMEVIGDVENIGFVGVVKDVGVMEVVVVRVVVVDKMIPVGTMWTLVGTTWTIRMNVGILVGTMDIMVDTRTPLEMPPYSMEQAFGPMGKMVA